MSDNEFYLTKDQLRYIDNANLYLSEFYGLRKLGADAEANHVKKYGTVEDLNRAQREQLYMFCYTVFYLTYKIFGRSPNHHFVLRDEEKIKTGCDTIKSNTRKEVKHGL